MPFSGSLATKKAISAGEATGNGKGVTLDEELESAGRLELSLLEGAFIQGR
jgi:hypothetical protein